MLRVEKLYRKVKVFGGGLHQETTHPARGLGRVGQTYFVTPSEVSELPEFSDGMAGATTRDT